MKGKLSEALAKYKVALPHVEEAARLEAEVARLEQLVYVPGMLKCKKCGFVLSKRILYMGSGTIGADNEPDCCPNDGAPMWRVSERELREEQFKDLLGIRNETLESVALMAEEKLLHAFAAEVRERKTGD